MTVAELYEGAYRDKWGSTKWGTLEGVLGSYLITKCSTRTCRLWGQVLSLRKHRPISAQDAWIAATALEYSCPLVSHDRDGFTEIPGLTVITEHEAPDP
jgi:tRNA(fMet)-specific endonuclease VapC